MSLLTFTETETDKGVYIYGLSRKSNDKSRSKDIPALTKKYYRLVNKAPGEVIPFYVLYKNYNEVTKDFELFVGGMLKNEGLETIIIPKGTYAKVTVKPKFGLIWGLSIGEAKKAFYKEWLPKSGFKSLNMEYEYHTEISKGKEAQIDILFAMEKWLNL